MKYLELDTPSLLIDREILMSNLHFMQDYANSQRVALRPHTKTHKMPYIAKLQCDIGAKGIAVAKVGEAQVMAANGLKDIFIANEIVGQEKLQRILAISETAEISFGVDTPCQVEAAQQVFGRAGKIAQVLIEIEVGENRSGIIEESDYILLLEQIKNSPNVNFKGIFSHEGHCYGATSLEHCHELFRISQERTLHFAKLAEEMGMKPSVVSIGSTPSLMQGFELLEGITELRPGTYSLMDASMANACNALERCSATILTTVISRPTDERFITDVGAKGLTAQTRKKGICAVEGMGMVKGEPGAYVSSVFDEHAIFYNKELRDKLKVGDKIEIIPVHICPVCNLYETAYLVSNGEVVQSIPILCRGMQK